MTEPLHVAASLQNLGVSAAAQMSCLEVVGFTRDAIEVVGLCTKSDDGLYHVTIWPDPQRHRAMALRLRIGDGRTRLSAAVPLNARRCRGLAVVVYDQRGSATRWEFGPEDDPMRAHDPELAALWRAVATRAVRDMGTRRGQVFPTTNTPSVSAGGGGSQQPLATGFMLHARDREPVASALFASRLGVDPIDTSDTLRMGDGRFRAKTGGPERGNAVDVTAAIDWLQRYVAMAGFDLPIRNTKGRDMEGTRR